MAETFKDNQIVAGHNNAGSLENIETLQDADGIYFWYVEDYPHWSLGQEVIRGDKQKTTRGGETTFWRNPVTFGQWYYIYHDILGDALSGNVTIRTRKFSSSYANYNAILTIRNITEYQRNGNWLDDFIWEFSDLEAI